MRRFAPKVSATSRFQNPAALLLLPLLPAAGFLFVYAERKRREALGKFAGARGESQGLIVDRRFEFACLMMAAGLIILALARPSWQQVPVEVTSEGRDVVFLLDVSRSMLAQDLAPDRLGVAKAAIRDCVENLEGDRVALVVFSGAASILCPLTVDYTFFFDKLEEAGPYAVAPGEVRIGGTRIGDAIHKTCDKLLSTSRRGMQDLILVSDGGDQESRPENAANRLENLGVYFIVVGIGDAIKGARIPEVDENGEPVGFVMHEEREVWTKLEAGGLETLARACRHGVFLNAGSRALPLGEIYPNLVRHFRTTGAGQKEIMMRAEETFPAFLAAALFLLAPPFVRWARNCKGATAAALCVFMVLGVGRTELKADEAQAEFARGWEQLTAKNYGMAIASFLTASEKLEAPRDRCLAVYNCANASFLQAKADEALDPQSSQTYYRQAAKAYRACLEMFPDFEDAIWNLEVTLVRLNRVSVEIENEMTQEGEASDEESSSESGEEGESEASEEEGDGEYEESEEEGAADPSAQSGEQNSMDLDAQDIPPPMVEPEELLEQEIQNAESRMKGKSSKYKTVEKDW